MTRSILALLIPACLLVLQPVKAQASCDDRLPWTCAPAQEAARGKHTRTVLRTSPGRAWSLFGASAAPSRFVRGRLTCARNVNAALAERGIAGSGSALAKSFLRWGRASAPQPGAVAVYNRGGQKGHAAIVSRVEGGQVWVWNPGRSGWREVIYPKRAIAYRVAAF